MGKVWKRENSLRPGKIWPLWRRITKRSELTWGKVRSYRKRETSPYKLHKISKWQRGRSYYYEPNLWGLVNDVPELKERIEEEAEAEAERVEREAERARKRRKRAEDSE